ncbi:MAG: trimeric intracellular cation channel family protein [Kiloniellales bacterium]
MNTLLVTGDYLGTLVFAIAGALAAAQKRLDFGGFVLLAFVTGVGGGTLRDVLLNRPGVFWAREPFYIAICVAGAAITWFGAERVGSYKRLLLWFDALGLALFAVIGAGIALNEGARPVVAAMMGAVTATGGGVIRDIIRNELPIVLHRDVYITAALLGASTTVLLFEAGAPVPIIAAGGFAIGFALRAAAIVWGLNLPVYRPRHETMSDHAQP